MANEKPNKIQLGDRVLIDLTSDTVTEDTMLAGTTAHDARGEVITGNVTVPAKNVWYGTSSTAPSTQTKVVTTTTGDFVVADGNIVVVYFVYPSGSNLPALNVDGTRVVYLDGDTDNSNNWTGDSVKAFVYHSQWDYFEEINGAVASTSYYGITKLSSSTSSTSTALAATPSAVKAAYDLANGKQDTLVSGTNIKTVNSTSLLGSGDVTVQPTLVSGTNIKTINSTSLLGSGNISVPAPSTTSTTISVANWNSTTTCSKSVTGVTSSNTVIVSPAPSSMAEYVSAGVYCSGQSNGSLTFSASKTPTSSITVNVVII